MEDFKLRSIEEFDSDFVASLQAERAKTQAAYEVNESIARARETLIPQVTVDVPSQENPPVDSIYTSEGMNSGEQVPFTDIYSQEAPKSKMGGGALAIKISAIVLLVSTVVVFLLGCFVSVFLDNEGFDLGGVTLSTLAEDVNIEKDNIHIKQGDMIIAKKADYKEYTPGKRVVVKDSEKSGSIIVVVNSNLPGLENSVLITSDVNGNFGVTKNYSSDDCLGVIQQYIPKLGSVISFAIENAILVCILFALLAAFWCLALVLVEKSAAKKVSATANNEPAYENVYAAPQSEDFNTQAEDSIEEINFDID